MESSWNCWRVKRVSFWRAVERELAGSGNWRRGELAVRSGEADVHKLEVRVAERVSGGGIGDEIRGVGGERGETDL